MTTVLGLNNTHDAAAALVRDGEIVMAIEEERLSRVKHHFGMPQRAMRACLERGGSSWADLPHAAFYMNPRLWLRSYGALFLRGLPASASFLGRKPALWRSFFGVERRLRRETGFRGRFHAVDHHAAHIDSAFWPSGFESAAALSIDGAGESATTVLARVDEQSQRRIAVQHYPVSLGKAWEAVTDWLGWQATRDEGKVMGLAPHGSPRFVDAFARILPYDGRPTFDQDLDYFAYYPSGSGPLVSDRFVAEFGAPRAPDAEIADHHRDVAFALQHQTSAIAVALARRVRDATDLPRLVMAGGVALNCVANGRVVAEGLFDDVFIQPAAGDAGAALGAALFVSHRKLGVPRSAERFKPFLGHDLRHPPAGSCGVRDGAPDDVVEHAAELLERGAVIGWVQGRMEFGPRALGNRSILADPRPPDMADRVNRQVKFREPFRPFAPAVLLERASDWFEEARPSPYMLQAFAVRPSGGLASLLSHT